MRIGLRKVAGTIGLTAQYFCIAHCTFEYLADFVLCSGPSMEPTIFTDNVLLTEHLTPKFRPLHRGDIVIAKCPTNPQQMICKRVTGLPGDRVNTGLLSYDVVPRGHVWLEGDNLSNSADSRTYGPVPQGLIKSRALCKVWPLEDITMLTN